MNEEKELNSSDRILSRTAKNRELYETINDSHLDNFNLNSNISVIGSEASNIDLDQIKSMLDHRYNSAPQRKSINIEVEEEIEEKKEDEPTKEYDLNSVLEKAREGNKVDYNIERLKKIKVSQYDILKNLDLDLPSEDDEEVVEKDKDATKEEDLMTLIDIATRNQSNTSTDIDPLDILTELKGSDDTVVLEGIHSEITEKLEEDLRKDTEPIETKEKIVEDKNSNSIENSFYTDSVHLTENDFEGFEDLKSGGGAKKIILWIIVALIIIAFLVGALLIVNNLFDLGLFK